MSDIETSRTVLKVRLVFYHKDFDASKLHKDYFYKVLNSRIGGKGIEILIDEVRRE